jgi:hypothetical protein
MASSVPSYITASVAILVAIISYRQWRTAHDRLRLDLYNRRLELYLSLLSMEDALAGWSGTAAQLALLDKFKRARSESRFLFPPESGVYELFDEFGKAIISITALDSLIVYELNNEPSKKTNWKQFRIDAWNKAVNVRWALDNQVAPLLEFSASGDPFKWIKRRRARASQTKKLAYNAQQARDFITKMGDDHQG